MSSSAIIAVATALLVLVGFAQVGVLLAQRRLRRLDLAEMSRTRWSDIKEAWATTVFIGREIDEYYQVAERTFIAGLQDRVIEAGLEKPTVWALDSVRSVTGLLSDSCLRVLQGQITVEDAYAVFGTELLRHSRPIRIICDPGYPTGRQRGSIGPTQVEEAHDRVLREIRDWLIYHDGIRRRCLILIDLLWAEAARVEDLPPPDVRSAAEAKRRTGESRRRRVREECRRLVGFAGWFRSWLLSRHLRHAEYKARFRRIGLSDDRLEEMEQVWEARLLRQDRV